ncbi:two-component sensor histidine kinase [Roseococcus sp. SDR]|uniref:sensor histidine kinase n=1 Tax=Roseococcus sp. SDR TaxID=2835532 RepID=UPI001BCBE18B|nr:ATP-binding protein [Roseococcus sp. SDR]MBS7792670.1 two-component sensor histidine kinase [Roseococcus sp. SDR]MBV1847984.1 two-component sensor histidine kinase [Roseococcus sp. SDR]
MNARPHSLQRRLGLGLALGTVLLWLAGSLMAGLILRAEVDEVFDGALQEVTQRILPLAYSEILNGEAEDAGQRLPSVMPHQERITYIVRDGDGRILLQSHDADAAAFPARPMAGFQDAGGLRLYTEVAVQGTFFVTAAEPLRHRRQAVLEAVGMLLWPLALLLPLTQLGVWALVRFALRPVSALQGEIEQRGQGDLSPVAATALPRELTPIAAAVNRLIARLQRALEAERGFTASSAHELRTPVAAALAQTQRLVAELPEGAPRERARSVEAALRQLARLSEKLLQLAKAEGAGLLAETPQDLAQVLAFVLDEFRGDADLARPVTVAMPEGGAWLSGMDADAFAILARNLIENALKHGAADQPVSVLLDEDGLLRVSNAGPVVAPETMARLKRPFERGESRAHGSGLGLAIAEAIAVGAGTGLELFSPVPGRASGFEARVRLPEFAPRSSMAFRPASD